MRYFDDHPDVLEWASEELVIPYVSPLDNRVHRYFPDFWIKMRDITGKICVRVIEIKPEKQTKPPVVQKKRTKKYITEVATWGINTKKWEAARNYCMERGWSFHIMTEKELGIA